MVVRAVDLHLQRVKRSSKTAFQRQSWEALPPDGGGHCPGGNRRADDVLPVDGGSPYPRPLDESEKHLGPGHQEH